MEEFAEDCDAKSEHELIAVVAFTATLSFGFGLIGADELSFGDKMSLSILTFESESSPGDFFSCERCNIVEPAGGVANVSRTPEALLLVASSSSLPLFFSDGIVRTTTLLLALSNNRL